MTAHAVRSLAVVLGGVLAVAGCESAPGDERTPEPTQPRLVKVSAMAGDNYSRVRLRFEPGTEEPTADVRELDDATVRVPASGKVVRLSGEQALRIVVSPATAGDVEIAPVPRDARAIAEMRVLGSASGQVSVGVGVKGGHDLSVRVFEIDMAKLVVSVRNPQRAADSPATHDCGSIGFEPRTDSGAFDVRARGVGCVIAREVAARAEDRLGRAYDTPSGFRCDPRAKHSQRSPTVDYVCTRGKERITFNAS